MAKNNIGAGLADLLATHNFDVEMSSTNNQSATADEATVFKFDYVTPRGRNYGTAVIVISDSELILFYGDNLGRGMEQEDKDDWFAFMKELKDFSIRHNFHNFSPKNLNQLKHTMQGMAAIKEGLFEGYYGNRRVSYMGEATDARLVIKHDRMIGENDKRYRYVESLFIETVDGERFRLPFKNLSGGRAMLEHVRQGGRPYDIRGQHITDTVNEMSVLSRFRRAQQGRVFEAATQRLVEQANAYYESLHTGLKRMATSRGYSAYFENWTPADIGPEESLVENLRSMFVQQTLDSRIEAALPTLAKLQGTTMKEADIFESWAARVAEGTWALPDNAEAQEKLNQLMNSELIVGPDAINATELLYDIVGDDRLYDILKDLADRNPRANIWDDSDVRNRMEELGIQLPMQSNGAEDEVGADAGNMDIAADDQLSEGDNLATFEGSCNRTMEGEYCPEHGLMECGMHEDAHDPVHEARVANPRVNEIRTLAKWFFGGNPYSSATISGGRQLRLSFHIGHRLDGDYRYVPASAISPADQRRLDRLKAKFMEYMAQKGVDQTEVSIQFHIGSGVYAGVRIAIPQEDGTIPTNLPTSTGPYKQYKGPAKSAANMSESVYHPNKPYGVQYIVFAGKEQRAVTKEAWFATAEAMERGVERIENLPNFYEIRGYHYPETTAKSDVSEVKINEVSKSRLTSYINSAKEKIKARQDAINRADPGDMRIEYWTDEINRLNDHIRNAERKINNTGPAQKRQQAAIPVQKRQQAAIPAQQKQPGVTPASPSKIFRLIKRQHNDWFDIYGMGEVEDTVTDMHEMDKFYGMSVEDAVALVGQELESLYGPDGMRTESSVAKYQDLGANQNTTHFVKNMTTGKIVSPHRSRHDAEDALVANTRGSNDEFKIVRARKSGVAEDSSAMPTEKVGSIIRRVLGNRLTWTPGTSKLYKNTRKNKAKTLRVDDYVMKYVDVQGVAFGSYDREEEGGKLAKALKTELVRAGYPVHQGPIIFSDQIMFQTRSPITVTTEGDHKSVSFRDMVNVVDRYDSKYYAELSASDISDEEFKKAIIDTYNEIVRTKGLDTVLKYISSGYPDINEGDDRGNYRATAQAAEAATRAAKTSQEHARAADLHDRAATYALSDGRDESVIYDHQMTAREHHRAANALKAFAVGERDGKAGAEKNKEYMSSALLKTPYLNGYKQGKQGVAEDAEQIDELSKDTLTSYRDQTKEKRKAYNDAIRDVGMSGRDDKRVSDWAKEYDRLGGKIKIANRKIKNKDKAGVAEGLANANETLRSQIIRLYKKGLEDYDIAHDLDIDEKTVADIIDDYDKKQQQPYSKKQGVSEGQLDEISAKLAQAVADKRGSNAAIYRAGLAATGVDQDAITKYPPWRKMSYKALKSQQAATQRLNKERGVEEGSSDLTDLWQAGKEAAYLGKPMSACPYQMFSKEWEAWQQGWQDQKRSQNWDDSVYEQGVSEGSPKDPNAPKKVQDRKTGKWYDPKKEFDKKMNSPEVQAQMKRMAQKEGVAEGSLNEGYIVKNGSKYLKGHPTGGGQMTWVMDKAKATVFKSKSEISRAANMRGWAVIPAQQGVAEVFASPGSGSTRLSSRGEKRIANVVRQALAKNSETPDQIAARKDFEAQTDARMRQKKKEQGVAEATDQNITESILRLQQLAQIRR